MHPQMRDLTTEVAKSKALLLSSSVTLILSRSPCGMLKTKERKTTNKIPYHLCSDYWTRESTGGEGGTGTRGTLD